MVEKIYLIYSKKDIASFNMAKFLFESYFDNFDTIYKDNNLILYSLYPKKNIYMVEVEDLLNSDFLNDYFFFNNSFLIFLSKHVSSKQIKSLSLHCTGNWNQDNSYGGQKEKISISLSKYQSYLIKELENNKPSSLDYNVTLEVTHHGPTLDFPLFFYEIGSSLRDWQNEKAIEFMVETLYKSFKILNKLDKEFDKVVFGIGGNHYASYYTKKIFDGYAIGHIIPKYAFEKEIKNIKNVLLQGIEKDFYGVTDVFVMKKSIPSNFRNEIIDFLNEVKKFKKIEVNIVK